MPKLQKTRNDSRNEGVAQNRYEIYKYAMSRYKIAMEQGFYLEATAIMESIIADRMESRLGELSQEEVEFGTLSELRRKLNGNLEQNPVLKKLFDQILSDWAGKRNKALHQVVKISKNEEKNWESFLKEAKEAALSGEVYFRKIDAELQKERSLI